MKNHFEKQAGYVKANIILFRIWIVFAILCLLSAFAILEAQIKISGGGGAKTYNITNNADDVSIEEVASQLRVKQSWIDTTTAATFVFAASDTDPRMLSEAQYQCDGSDDELTWYTAVAAFPSSGPVYAKFLPGTYYFDTSGSLNAALGVDGRDSVFIKGFNATAIMDANNDGYFAYFNNGQGGGIEGWTVDGNGPNQTSIGKGVHLRDWERGTVTDNELFNFRDDAISVWGGGYNIITNNKVDSVVTGDGIELNWTNPATDNETRDNFVYGNHIRRVNNQAAMRMQSTYNSVLALNFATDCFRYLTNANDNVLCDTSFNNFVIANPSIAVGEIEHKGLGIGWTYYMGNGATVTKFTIDEGDFGIAFGDSLNSLVIQGWIVGGVDGKLMSTGEDYNIRASDAGYLIVKDNTFIMNGGGGDPFDILGYSYAYFDNNTFLNAGQGTIKFGSRVINPQLYNNTIDGNATAATKDYGLWCEADSLIAINNRFSHYKTHMILKGAGNYVEDNTFFGHNVGADTAISLFGSAQDPNNVFKNNTMRNLNQGIVNTKTNVHTSNFYWNNIDLTTANKVSSNNWTLGNRSTNFGSGYLTINDTLDFFHRLKIWRESNDIVFQPSSAGDVEMDSVGLFRVRPAGSTKYVEMDYDATDDLIEIDANTNDAFRIGSPEARAADLFLKRHTTDPGNATWRFHIQDGTPDTIKHQTGGAPAYSVWPAWRDGYGFDEDLFEANAGKLVIDGTSNLTRIFSSDTLAFRSAGATGETYLLKVSTDTLYWKYVGLNGNFVIDGDYIGLGGESSNASSLGNGNNPFRFLYLHTYTEAEFDSEKTAGKIGLFDNDSNGTPETLAWYINSTQRVTIDGSAGTITIETP
jgi:hypothetical protein